MILADVKIILYAFRKDAPDHEKYRDWLKSILDGDAFFGVSPQVLSSVIRISTHPQIYGRPDPLEDVLAFIEVLLKQPNCQLIEPGPRHWEIFCRYCRVAQATGNLVQDAWFAALATESGCEWITADGHYAKFPGLRWRRPF